jgi:hypothetical protein
MYGYPRKRYFEKRPTYQTDCDGDIKMKGAKVNMEKARKEGLHMLQLRNCGASRVGIVANQNKKNEMTNGLTT